MGLFFTAIITLIIAPTYIFRIIAIILLIISLIIYLYNKRKRHNEKIDYLNGLIKEYRKRGFDDDFIKKEISGDLTPYLI